MIFRSHCMWRDERHEWETSHTGPDDLGVPLEQGWGPVPVVTGKSGRAVAAAVSAPPGPLTIHLYLPQGTTTGGFLLATEGHTQPEVPES